jgi:hypothetical protein
MLPEFYLRLGTCTKSNPRNFCGDGTIYSDDKCVTTVTCGENTKFENGKCVPDTSKICLEGTIEMNGKCMPGIPETSSD